ncbi:MAG: UDP-N-acetylmuramoyl-L-alanyl-D-glutamate--2,6-diaminopimelate ligase [Peptococcaceae bacterium]|nr:UDP-N-acetylmuramoyl-L-alanyl-D-glutamate--2,6-diaminopimelate ligase [Peptococcaceae bacterium]
MLLSDLCGAIGARPEGDLSLEITHITNNSKEVREGSLFICVPGLKTDGHKYAPEALERGAVALVLERDVPCRCPKLFVDDSRAAQAKAGSFFYGNPTSLLEMVGVTGTNGKTTITFMIEAILKAAGVNTGVIGTINYRYMDKIFRSERTTPDSIKLQKILRDMVDAGVEAVVMEVSSHALDLNRVDGCEFDAAILSNITHDHFDFHKDHESYLASKFKLFEMTAAGGSKQKKAAILNADDPHGLSLAGRVSIPVITYGIDGPADIRAYNITLGTDRCSFDLDIKNGYYSRIHLNMPGKANVYNALASISYAHFRQIDMDLVKKGLMSLAGVPGRFEKIDCGQPFTVVVDFAHNPDGLEKLITYCDKKPGSRKIVVFGCEGGKDRTKRPVMGEVAARHADISIITTDNMYGESPEKVAGEIEAGLKRYNKRINSDYHIITDRYEAIKTALELAGEGDMVFIAGKGHETVQLLFDRQVPFNDREVVVSLLRKRYQAPPASAGGR